jgi:hypothetical protein
VLAGLVPASPSAVTSGTPKSLDAYRTQQADKDKPDYQWLVPTPPLHHPPAFCYVSLAVHTWSAC